MKEIPGFEGRYLIDKSGNIFSLYRALYKLKPEIDQDGYLRAGLWKEGKKFRFFVHYLMLLTFVGPRPIKHQCAHLDGNKRNNTINNLKYVLQNENEYHKKLHGRGIQGSRNPKSKLTKDQVLSIRKDFVRTSARKSNQIVLAKKYGIAAASVSAIINRKVWVDL